MIIIPEKVAFIKVPKAASTAIARLFWEQHGVEQFGSLDSLVATNVRHFITLDQVAKKIPILNGNWFFNRSKAFGWHAGFHDLMHVFGDQLKDFHWVASVRHPVERLFSAFSFQIAKDRLNAQLCADHFEKFCEFVFEESDAMTQQQRIHTWSQSHWLPDDDEVGELSIIRQERLGEDIAALAHRIPSFADAQVGRHGQSFGGEWRHHVSPQLEARIADYYAEDMVRFGY